MRDCFKIPEKAYFQLSPGENYISHTEPDDKRMNMFIQLRSGGEAKRITSVTGTPTRRTGSTSTKRWRSFWRNTC